MSLQPLRTVRDLLADDVWRFALVAGGLSAWVVLSEAWPSLDHLDFEPVVLAAFVSGFLFATRSEDAKTVGFRVGLVGSVVPIVVQSGTYLDYIFGLPQPMWTSVLFSGFLTAAVVVFVLVVAVVSAFAASAGDWVAGKLGRSPHPTGH